jgi:hypothetical protein
MRIMVASNSMPGACLVWTFRDATPSCRFIFLYLIGVAFD